jgi:hypothetical protein
VCGSDGCASSSDLLILGQSRRRQAENPLIDLSRFSSPALIRADLNWALLLKADLSNANLARAGLTGANLTKANLFGADLSRADLSGAVLVEANLTGADLTGCRVYGVSAWNVKLSKDTKQQDLVITDRGEPAVTVDNIEVAQFIYLLLQNEKIRDVIDTVARKGVLLLGRFTEGRMAVLDRLRNELRKRGYRFESPQLHQEVRGSRHVFLRRRIALHVRWQNRIHRTLC